MKCFLLELSNGFLDVTPRTQGIGEEMIHLTELFFKKYASNATTKERKRNQKSAREDL